MAAAEVRAAWQRTANRCFVQEDAKRAPKLACCQSSSSTSKQVDAGATDTIDRPDNPALGFTPFNKNSAFSNLSPDTIWGLQLRSNYGYQKGFTYEQLNELEAKVETLRTDIENAATTFGDVHSQKGDIIHVDDENSESSLDMQYGLASFPMSKAPEVIQESKALYVPEFPWFVGDKTEPWWRTTDKNELVSLVWKKSQNNLHNCDLPPPQKMHVRRYQFAHIGCLDHDEALGSSFNWEARTGGISDRIHTRGCPGTEKTLGNQGASSEEGRSQYGDQSFSCSSNQEDIREGPRVSEGAFSKSELMEALCHSQTRAREAEKTAKQLYAEKEHILQLFFRQAVQLLAYKQWFQLLQLEIFNIPLRATAMSYKARKQRAKRQKNTRQRTGKQGGPRHDITKYAFSFALGFSLVGAGLLVGWTVGWMSPPL